MSRRNTVKRAKTGRNQRLEMDALWARVLEALARREGPWPAEAPTVVLVDPLRSRLAGKGGEMTRKECLDAACGAELAGRFSDDATRTLR